METVNELKINGKYLSAYLLIIEDNPTVVLGKNISDVCDKLEQLGIENYSFEYHSSLNLIK